MLEPVRGLHGKPLSSSASLALRCGALSRLAAVTELRDLDGDEQAQNLYHQMADTPEKY